MRSITVNHIILGCFLLALLVRVAYLNEQALHSVTFSVPMFDEAEMARVATRLVEGEGFGPTPLFKAPLYPLIISLFMHIFGEGWIFAVKLFQHFCGAILVALAAKLAAQLAGSQKDARLPALLTGILFALYAPIIRLEHRLVLDFLTVFFQSLLLFWMLQKPSLKRDGFIGGATLLSLFNRPTILPVLPILAVYMAVRERSWRPVACVLIPVFIALTAVGVRNHVVAGEGLMMPWQGGYNFYEANRQGASGRYLAVSQVSFEEVDNPTITFSTQPYLNVHNLSEIDSYKRVNHYWYDRAKHEILDAPEAWLLLMLKKGFYLVSEREIFNFEDYHVQRKLSTLLQWMPGSFGVLWPLALAGLVGLLVYKPRASTPMVLLWIYIIFLGGAIALFYTSGRMRMPLAWPLAVLAGVSISQLWAMPAALKRVWCGIFILGLFLSWGDWWGVRSEKTAAMEYIKLSSAAWKAASPEHGLRYAEAAEALGSTHPMLPQLKAQALYELNRIDEAEESFIESIERLPSDPVAPYNLACLYLYHKRDYPNALRYAEETIHRSRQHHRAQLMKIRLLIKLGKNKELDGALENYSETILIDGNNPSVDWLITQYFLLINSDDQIGHRERIKTQYGPWGEGKLNREIQAFSE